METDGHFSKKALKKKFQEKSKLNFSIDIAI